MPLDDYYKARRLGQREASQREQKRMSPYLPALENRVGHLNALARVQLGVKTIPLKNIIGTATNGRANAFAANFMPILGPASEFAHKWQMLYEDVVENGVRQPVTALEYLNQYYLLEGNKRVSVSKYLDAAGIEADVTRVMPPADADDPETRLYREFLPFAADSGVTNIWFSREGSAARLYELTGKQPGVKWSDEEAADFRAGYYYFRAAYKRVIDEKLTLTTGDAFLIYLEVFGYERCWERSAEQLREQISQLYCEYLRFDETRGVELIMEPNAESQSGSLLHSLFGPSKLKVAFLYNRSPEISGWMYWHELGRVNLETEMKGRVETTARLCENPENFELEIERLIAEGNKLIFTTSPAMIGACVRPSLRHPDVKILNCSLLASYYNVRSYYVRTYEAKLLLGMLAGATADNNQIGYIADYPIFGLPSSINAFALGARMVNPRAKIYLTWSALSDFDEAHPFDDPEIRVISNRDVSAPSHTALNHGLFRLTDEGEMENLGIPILDWGKMYLTLARSILNGKWGADMSGARALDYWWGMSAGAIDIAVTQRLDPALARLIDMMRDGLRDGTVRPFEGLLVDQKGVVRCEKDEALSPAQILAMNYLLDNVVGHVPHTDRLRPEARALVELQGLRERRSPDVEEFSWSTGSGEA